MKCRASDGKMNREFTQKPVSAGLHEEAFTSGEKCPPSLQQRQQLCGFLLSRAIRSFLFFWSRDPGCSFSSFSKKKKKEESLSVGIVYRKVCEAATGFLLKSFRLREKNCSSFSAAIHLLCALCVKPVRRRRQTCSQFTRRLCFILLCNVSC